MNLDPKYKTEQEINTHTFSTFKAEVDSNLTEYTCVFKNFIIMIQSIF